MKNWLIPDKRNFVYQRVPSPPPPQKKLIILIEQEKHISSLTIYFEECLEKMIVRNMFGSNTEAAKSDLEATI